jgi:hypothetical protein
MTCLMNFWRAGHSPLTRSFYESDLFPKMAKNWQMNRAATMRTDDGFLTLSSSINCFTLIRARFYRICFCWGLIGVIRQLLLGGSYAFLSSSSS